MKPYLLDVNVLIALAWPSHVHHSHAQRWFARKSAAGFRTCPLTQLGFVRISSNPKFTAAAVSPRDALRLLERITALPGHKFWPANLDVVDSFGRTAILGHRQILDAYLIELARAHRGVLATLDQAVRSLVPGREHLLELVPSF